MVAYPLLDRQESYRCAHETRGAKHGVDRYPTAHVGWWEDRSGSPEAHHDEAEIVGREGHHERAGIDIFIEVAQQENLIPCRLPSSKETEEVQFKHGPGVTYLPLCLNISCVLVPHCFSPCAPSLRAARLISDYNPCRLTTLPNIYP